MVGKLCAAPAKGGAASGLIEYLVGYAISEKGATRREIADALDGVYAESEQRPDLGVDAVWRPEAGGGTRPSSILVRNCASFSTASLEIDADGARNPGIRSSAMHFVWSWNERESGFLTDEQAHAYVGQILEKLELRHHRSVAVVHRDTDNLHVHCAVGAVDPGTGLAYDRTGLHRKMAWAEREIELANGLDHDRGLAVVQDAGLTTAHVRWADKFELAAWRAERREERLVRQERRSFEGYRERDGAFDRYVDATLGPRLLTALDLDRQRGVADSWATLHAVAARYGCELSRGPDGAVAVRDVGVGAMRTAHEQERRSARAGLLADGFDRGDADEQLAELRAKHAMEETVERERKKAAGDIAELPSALQERVRDLPEFQDAERSERSIIEQVERNSVMVLTAITAQSSTFTREDIDQWLSARISNPDEIERLGDLVVRADRVRVLSADPVQPLMTTTEILAIEDTLDADARRLAATASGITQSDVGAAIRSYEQQEALRRGHVFRLSDEQRASLQQLSRASLVAIEGLPGVGKTTIQGAVRALGEQLGREVVGLTLSQAAAERLESEAGFRCVNTARARMLEEGNNPVIPNNGIVVVDEAAMVDSRANGKILELARARGSVVVEIGDVRQLQPIDFGASFRIVRDAARDVGTYCELRDIQRQERGWHREAVVQLADAIVERDENTRLANVGAALRLLEDHGAITWTDDRDAAIDAAIECSQARRSAGLDTLTLASDKDSVRHLSEEDRRRDGREGKGRRYATDGGLREFASGDRLMFLENSLGRNGLGVRNGDRGTVLEAKPHRIIVQLDGKNEQTVAFSPTNYRAFDYANACTVHKSQGASVDAAVSLIDRNASAELLFVAASRSRRELDIVVPRSAFRDIHELAEHIAERISLKTTTRTYDEVLERTGGKETIRVQNIEAQREALPLRRVYEADVVEPLRALQLDRVDQAREAYRERKLEIAESRLSIEDRLDAGRDALRAMRTAVTAAYRELRPLPFGGWLQEREERREGVRPSVDQRAEEEQAVHRERGEFSQAEEISHSQGLRER
ncbi:MAG: AAA family ATPase [Candidatus Eremiobacteraeota bacterium]|nr:AAA family ATPase [Candidatus Eremiobacteraeota bacterium]